LVLKIQGLKYKNQGLEYKIQGLNYRISVDVKNFFPTGNKLFMRRIQSFHPEYLPIKLLYFQ
jgi:hypothetical protein